MARWVQLMTLIFLTGFLGWQCSDQHQAIVAYTPTTSNEVTLEQIAQWVNADNEYKAVYTFANYNTLLQELTRANYLVLPLNEFRQFKDDSKIVVGMRHDIDADAFKALTLARMENQYGLRTTYFVLHSARYYGEFTSTGVKRYPVMNEIYQTLAHLGHEIGVHNDLLSLMIWCNIDPLTFQLDEIAFYQRLQIPIFGTAAHGSQISIEAKIYNYNIFKDFCSDSTFLYKGTVFCYGKPFPRENATQSHVASTDTSRDDPARQFIFKKMNLADFGFEYEAYHISNNKYLSDSGGRWNGDSVKDPVLFLRACKPGDRVQILTHPLWWGRQRQRPANIATTNPVAYNVFEPD
ncbi:hypothetical protein L0128_21370 [candidate division KSB1 bacterium]|nr:hypothetical protein [candidate division KSB1 bacterium]